METTYLGIDPGLTGAWTLLDARGALISCALVPVFGTKGKRVVDIASLVAQLRASIHPEAQVVAALEQVGAMPGQGVTSMFTFGRTVGAWDGIIAAHGWRRVDVRPQAWTKLVPGGRIDKKVDRKAAAAHAARGLWPTLPLARVKDYAIADAALIAEWARQQDVAVARA